MTSGDKRRPTAAGNCDRRETSEDKARQQDKATVTEEATGKAIVTDRAYSAHVRTVAAAGFGNSGHG